MEQKNEFSIKMSNNKIIIILTLSILFFLRLENSKHETLIKQTQNPNDKN